MKYTSFIILQTVCFTAKFVVSLCAFCVFWRNFGFFCSIKHLNRPLRKHIFTWTSSNVHGLWFVIGGFQSLRFVSVFLGLLLVIVLFQAIIDKDFSDLSYSCHFQLKQCLPPFQDKNFTHPGNCLCHSQFCFCGPSWEALEHCDLHYGGST